jgi:hypothetical protein
MSLSRLYALAPAILGMVLGGCSSYLPATAAPLDTAPSLRSPVRLAGLDPYDTRCASDAITASKALVRDAAGELLAFVELHRSARCQTIWARAVRVSASSGALVATVRGQGYTSAFEHATDGEVWTDMVPSSRGCAAATGGIRSRGGVVQNAEAVWCVDGARIGFGVE